jgi:hypothetical protein
VLNDMKRGIFPKNFETVSLPKHSCSKVQIGRFEEAYDKLTKWSSGRIRYRPHCKLYYVNKDMSVNMCYSLYRAALCATGNEDIIHRYHLDCLMSDLADVKQLSDYMKKKGESATTKWRYLVDMHRLSDFLEPKTEADFLDDIKDWVQRKPVHTWDGNEDLWYEKYKQAVHTVFFRSGRSPGELIPIDDFCSNPDYWATSGSGYNPFEQVKLTTRDITSDREIKPMKTKWAVAWALTKYKVKRLIYKRKPAMQKGVMKSEPAKVRAVIAGDLALYLKMCYVDTWLNKWFMGRQDSTLWMSSKDRVKLWAKMKPDGTWRMPLDQASFDKNVTLRQINIILEEIKSLIERSGVPELIPIMEDIIYAINNSVVLFGGERINVTNGILSGWRWTAFFDTIVNLAEVVMAKEWLYEHSYPIEIKDLNAQGDDDWFKLDSYADCVAMWYAYHSFGLEVNPGKFFVSRTRDEYLRRVLDRDKVTGYPARSITTLMFRNPVNERETMGAERHRQNFSKWKLFAERLDSDVLSPFFKQGWLRDTVQSDKNIDKDKALGWLGQSVMVGGIGYESPPVSLNLVPTSLENHIDNIDIEYPGYKEWEKHVEGYGVENSTAKNFCVSTLNFRNDVRLPKWVKYIYSNLPIKTSVPVGNLTNQSGTVGVGKWAYTVSYRHGWKWFPDYISLKSVEHYGGYMWSEHEDFLTYEHITGGFSPSRKHYKLNPKKGITIGTAYLSSTPELAFENYNKDDFKHVPRRWLKDYTKGQLKAKLSPRKGWGMDIVGEFGKEILNTAINKFVLTSRPSMRLWNTFLSKIDASIPTLLDTLGIYIVE